MEEIFEDDDIIDGEMSLTNEITLLDSIISVSETYLIPTLNKLYTNDKARKAFIALYFMCNGSVTILGKCLETIMWSLLS